VDVAGQVLLTPFLISWREDKCGPARNVLKVTRGSWPTSAVDWSVVVICFQPEVIPIISSFRHLNLGKEKNLENTVGAEWVSTYLLHKCSTINKGSHIVMYYCVSGIYCKMRLELHETTVKLRVMWIPFEYIWCLHSAANKFHVLETHFATTHVAVRQTQYYSKSQAQNDFLACV
jgi:hypothetical protein